MASSDVMADHENSHLKRAFALTDAKQAAELYDEWAGTYDNDLKSMHYSLAATASIALVSTLKASGADLGRAKVLDAGCGTGLVGISLAQSSIDQIDGLDISQGMLDVATKTEAYRKLEIADLSKSIDCPDEFYDAVICVGTLTQGHLGPGPIQELVRVSKSTVVLTVGGGLWESDGYRRKVDELSREGRVRILGSEVVGVTEGQTEGAQLVVLAKI